MHHLLLEQLTDLLAGDPVHHLLLEQLTGLLAGGEALPLPLIFSTQTYWPCSVPLSSTGGLHAELAIDNIHRQHNDSLIGKPEANTCTV